MRQLYWKWDNSTGNETIVLEKRQKCTGKETIVLEKRQKYWKRDKSTGKETKVYWKWDNNVLEKRQYWTRNETMRRTRHQTVSYEN